MFLGEISVLAVSCYRNFRSCNSSHTRNQGKAGEITNKSAGLQNRVRKAANRVKKGEGKKSSKWVQAKLVAKGPGALESTFSGAQRCGGKKVEIQELWRELFADPTEWRDHRFENVNPRFPDFKHMKQRHKALWINSEWTPPWVKEKLAALPSGTIQSSPFSWNQRLSRYAKAGDFKKTMELFHKMEREGRDMDRFTFSPALNACSNLGLLEHGRHIHKMMQPGFEADLFIGSSLVDMYAKCGSIEEAKRVFNQMPTRNVIAWTAMIVGFVKCGEGQKALELYEEMQLQGVNPNHVTLIGVLNACASVAALEAGRCTHEVIIQRGFELDGIVGNCLIDMYAKCGSIKEARRVFNQMHKRDVVSWNAMIHGYGSHGSTRKALETFDQMCQIVEVNAVTFQSLLSACSHGGLVDEGLEYFKSMCTVYNISPTVGHFTCVVDILGRAGRLNEVEDLIESMPMDPDATVWMSMLCACRAHVNVEVGEHCAKRLLELDPENSAVYVLLSDIYVAAGK